MKAKRAITGPATAVVLGAAGLAAAPPAAAHEHVSWIRVTVGERHHAPVCRVPGWHRHRFHAPPRHHGWHHGHGHWHHGRGWGWGHHRHHAHHWHHARRWHHEGAHLGWRAHTWGHDGHTGWSVTLYGAD